MGNRERFVDWRTVNWKKVNKIVKNLRQRIYRATQNGQWNKVRSLMKLMIRSFSNLLLAVRKVTQVNIGKRTAGVDGHKALNPEERVKLVTEMLDYKMWQAQPTKRLYIPKANGKLRPLGIPTIRNRVAQAIVKNALEPSWEALFEAHSYGFRPGRSAQDAIQQVHLRFSTGKDEWALDADIKGAFDNINHEYLLKTIGNVPGRELIKQWLKAGYVEMGQIHSSPSGTPQGGVISPLLANIALHGLGEFLEQFITKKVMRDAVGKRLWQKTSNRYGFIRYADDFVITAKKKEDLEFILPYIQGLLETRGLELNQEKTRIVHISDGFNFLGYNIKRYKKVHLVKPQKEKVLNLIRGLREWLKTNSNATPEQVVEHFNPILRGWGNYHRTNCSGKAFKYVDWKVWEMLYNWALKRHQKRHKQWIVQKYFTTNGIWKFKAKGIDRRGNPTTKYILKLSEEMHILRHAKVKDKASPDDPTLKAYWKQRQTQYGKLRFAKGSLYYKIAVNQDWNCPVCGEYLFNGEDLEIHHKVMVKAGGKEDVNNLVHLHKACHKNIHSGKQSGDVTEA
ncbi:group II intron reverse transcriptase/maturase [Scytonema sp. UIC 10036]|uniref:group II intron reverse transcriptase/maturase n=1 Tax=Scytonema sp. UIC 10036 TaxID=2304196 RepID=UPI00325BC832